MTAETLPATVVLHLGAHKTASTHLQHAIIAAKPLDGVAFYGPRLLRGIGDSIPERFGFPFDPDTAKVSRLSPRQMLAQMAEGAAWLVLSEETFAGKLQRGWGRIPTPLYFTAPARVERLAQIVGEAGGPQIDLCLAIRNPTDFLGSAYSQILCGNRIVLPEKYRAKNAVADIDWADYVARLRAVPGVGKVTVWRQEDYAELFPQVCCAMVGRDDISVLQARVQPRLSAKAVDAILVAKTWGGPELIQQAAEALPITPDNPPYDLYTAAEHAASRNLYAAQCEAINGMDGVTLLRQLHRPA